MQYIQTGPWETGQPAVLTVALADGVLTVSGPFMGDDVPLQLLSGGGESPGDVTMLQEVGTDAVDCTDEEYGVALYVLTFQRNGSSIVSGVQVQGLATPYQTFLRASVPACSQ
jgi:hypothetical protein